MKKISSFLVLTASLFLFSCGGDDEPTPAHQIGSWKLDGFKFINLPSTHTAWQDIEPSLAFVFGAPDAEDLFLDLNADGSYLLRLVQTDRIDVDGEGEWELDKGDTDDDVDILTLTPNTTDANKLSYDILKNENDKLEMTEPISLNLYSDAVLLANNFNIDSLDALPTEERNKLISTVSFELLNVYNRK